MVDKDIVLKETHNKAGVLVTKTYQKDGKKYIEQYNEKGEVVLHIDLGKKDKIFYDDEGRIKTHVKDLDPEGEHKELVLLDVVEYDEHGKVKHELRTAQNLDTHAYVDVKTKSFTKGISKASGTTKFEKTLQDLYIGYLIVNVSAALLKGISNKKFGEMVDKIDFPGMVTAAKNNLLSSISLWQGDRPVDEEIAKMKNYALSTDWVAFANQHRKEWHPAEDPRIRSWLPHLDFLSIDSYKEKGWGIIEAAYKSIVNALDGNKKALVKNITKKERD